MTVPDFRFRFFCCTCAVLASLVLAAGAGSAAAKGWGSIRGKLVYKGSPPVQEKLKVNKDIAVCTKHHPVDESLVVSEEGGLANVIVFIRNKSPLDVHASYEDSADDEVVLDNNHCRFAPHVAVLRTSQTLVLKNSDAVAHNVKADLFRNGSFNVLIPPGQSIEKNLPNPERLPSPVGCNIHPWMASYLLVRDDPYMVVSAKDGTFKIENIPAGEHEFQLWQEKAGYLDGAKIEGEAAKKGRFTRTIKDGATIDLGEIEVSAKVFD